MQVGALNLNETFSGTIKDGNNSGVIALAKSGTGTMTLSGTSTYAGGTTITGGTLNVTGALSGSGSVVVNSGGTLAGTGSIAGATTINSGGRISPGNAGAGTLTLSGAVTLQGSSVLDFDLGTISASDKLALSGSYSGPTSGFVTININPLTGFGDGTYTLITGATGISAANFSLGTTPSGRSYLLSANNGTLTLAVTTWTAVESWRNLKFGSIANTGTAADTADPDGDGRSNLLEYATGTEPNIANSGSVQMVGRSGDGLRLTLAFNRIADPALTYVVEAKDELTAATWTTIWSSTGASNVAGSVTVSDTELIAEHTKRFLRLRIVH